MRDREAALQEVLARTGWPGPAVPWCDGAVVRFAFFDHEGSVQSVRLRHGLAGHRQPPQFANEGDGLFTLEFEAGNAERVEYMLELRGADGRMVTIHDPLNDLLADGPGGAKSVVQRTAP